MFKALLLMVILFGAVGQLAHCGQEQKATEGHEQTTQQTKQSGVPISSTTQVTNCQKCCPNQTDAAQQISKWDEATTPPTWSNWALVVVGFGGIGAALLTLVVIYIQTNHILNSERAWILTGEATNSPEFSRDIPHDTWITIIPKNHGKTPGWITNSDLRFLPMPKHSRLPSKPDYSTDDRMVAVIAPDKTFPLALLIPSGLFRGAISGIEALYIYGNIDYLDIGKKERHTRFCYKYTDPADHLSAGGPPRFLVALDVPPAYTECT